MRWRGWNAAAVASMLALALGCGGKSSETGAETPAASGAGGGAGMGAGAGGSGVGTAPVGGAAAGSLAAPGGVGGCPAPDACVGGSCATGIIGGTQGLSGGSAEGGAPVQVTYIDCAAYERCGLMTGCTSPHNDCVSVPGCRGGSICTSMSLLCEACSGECLSLDSYPPQLSCSTGDIMGYDAAAGASGQSRVAPPCR